MKHEIERQMVEAYREGATLQQVADRFGVSPGMVARTVRRIAPEATRSKGPPPRLSSTEARQVVEAYREGATLQEVGDRFGVSGAVVARAIRRIAPEAMRPKGHRPRLSSTEEWQLVEAYREGATLQEVADRFGVSGGVVARAIRRIAPEAMRPKGHRPRLSSTEERQLVGAYREGATFQEVADRFGVSYDLVSKTVHRIAPEALRSPRGRRTLSSTPELLERWEAGETLSQLGRRYGISRQAVQQRIQRLLARRAAGRE